ncbi:MAG: spinster family MFS transporter [Parvularcula sp.]
MTTFSGNQSPDENAGKGYRAWVLFILVVVYTFNFIDRQIVGILAVPIKEDLGISDTQLSILIGFAFAMFYATLGIPIAWLADRTNRTWIMTGALGLWSLATAACGFTQNYIQLVVARLGVGVGEAGGVAPAYSIISDYFPPNKRARALGIYSFGIPIGGALGFILGGVLASLIDWRAAFIYVGVAGLLIAPIFKLTVKEPPRGQFDGAASAQKAPPITTVVRTLMGKPSFWTMSLGAAFSSMVGYGLLGWMPSFFVRSFGEVLPGFFDWVPIWLLPDDPQPILYAAFFAGSMLFVGGLVGVWIGGVLGDRLGQGKKGAYAAVPGAAFLITFPFFFMGISASTLTVAFWSLLVVQVTSLVWLGPVISAFQHLVPASMRATASSIFLFINNLVGIGMGNFIFGFLSDILKPQYGEESLRYAIMYTSGFYLVAAGLMFITARRLARDWHEE